MVTTPEQAEQRLSEALDAARVASQDLEAARLKVKPLVDRLVAEAERERPIAEALRASLAADRVRMRLKHWWLP